MPTADVNGIDIAFQEKGPWGSAPAPLVLLHGFPLDARVWEAQLSGLSDRFHVLAVDLPGFGQSKSDKPFSIESQADAVHAMLEKLGLLPVVLGGLSMGGYVSLAYAKKYPTDLKGLVLVDTKAEADTPQAREGRDKMVELVRQKGSPAVAEQMMPKMIAAGAEASKPELAKRLRGIMDACPPKTIEHALLAMRDRPDFSWHLASIPVPTLIVVGEADAITPPAMAESMKREIPRATLSVIRGAGHMSPMEQPDQVNEAMRKFLSSFAG